MPFLYKTEGGKEVITIEDALDARCLLKKQINNFCEKCNIVG